MNEKVSAAVFGTVTMEHLIENTGAVDVVMPEKIRKKIRERGKAVRGGLAFFHPVITLMITYAGAWVLRKLLRVCHLEWMNPVLGIGGE